MSNFDLLLEATAVKSPLHEGDIHLWVVNPGGAVVLSSVDPAEEGQTSTCLGMYLGDEEELLAFHGLDCHD